MSRAVSRVEFARLAIQTLLEGVTDNLPPEAAEDGYIAAEVIWRRLKQRVEAFEAALAIKGVK